MKKISVDMDGVLADVYHQFITMHAAEFGKIFTLKETYGKPEAEVFPNERKYVTSTGFFRDAPVMEDSQRVLKALNDRYKVFIVSAAMEFPNSLPEKLEWLNEHFPFITWHQTVFCGTKDIIKADIMIDDHFRNLNSFSGDETIMFTQPHNFLADPGKHKRVSTWKEIEAILLT